VQAVAEMTGLNRKQIYARALSLGAPVSGAATKNKNREPADDKPEKKPKKKAK
jgi:hypothetical protein